ncbi:diguanylate cyclase regulator RdcB family protein [Escherichia coli]
MRPDHASLLPLVVCLFDRSDGRDYADFLSWLGKWTTADKQPVCWSVTQRWHTVALGMPRLVQRSVWRGQWSRKSSG